MKTRAIIMLLMLCCCCVCNAQALKFSEPIIDDTKLPDASTTILMHFENNLLDIGGNTWGQYYGYDTFTFSSDAAIGAYSLYGASTNGAFIVTAATDSMTIGTDDFTLDFFLKTYVYYLNPVFTAEALAIDVNSGAQKASFVIHHSPLYFPIPAPHKMMVGYSTTTGEGASWYDTNAAAGWYHICFERIAGIIHAYVDGHEVFNCLSTYDFSGLTSIVINQKSFNSSYQIMSVQIDELRVKKNGYVYGGDFDPPTRSIGLKMPNRIRLTDGKINF